MKRNLRLLSILFMATLLDFGLYSLAESKPFANLRSSYKDLTVSQVQSIPYVSIRSKKNWGFFGHSTTRNNYEVKIINNNGVVVDYSTGLMWHRSGSIKFISWWGGKKWIGELNKKGYAGFNDWRLPTLEEAVSLLEPVRSNGMYIDLVFDKNQYFIWTGDTKDSGHAAWLVSYQSGSVYWLGTIHYRFVRPVRTMK